MLTTPVSGVLIGHCSFTRALGEEYVQADGWGVRRGGGFLLVLRQSEFTSAFSAAGRRARFSAQKSKRKQILFFASFYAVLFPGETVRIPCAGRTECILPVKTVAESSDTIQEVKEMAACRSKKRTWNERIARREMRRRSGSCIWYSTKDSMNEFVILPGGERMLLRRGFGAKMLQREARRFCRRAAAGAGRHDASYE